MLGCLLTLNSSCCTYVINHFQEKKSNRQIYSNLATTLALAVWDEYRQNIQCNFLFLILWLSNVFFFFYTRQRLLLLHARRRKIGKVATTMSTQILQVKRLPRVPIESGQKGAPRRVDTESNPPLLVTGLKDPSTQSHRSSQAQWIALDHANLFSPLILYLFTFFVPGIRELVMAVFCFVVGINALAMLVMIVDVGII